ncbi:MAG TPA: ABC transporter substrate-binding protein [Candidatus Binatia bacterium]|jgi:NitT/TauT family transport system substrate-binding protein
MAKRRVLFVLLAAVSFFAQQLSAETIKAGYVSRDLNYLPFFVAQKKGFYAAEGVQVELVFIGGADLQLRALVAGELHVANINPDSVILWDEKGGTLKTVAGSSNAAPYYLVGGKNYKRIEDLKGARLGVASLTGGATSILLGYLKSKGLQHPRDFSLAIITGGTPARLSALESGAIAGAVLGVPFADMAIDKGFNKLGDTTEVIHAYQFNAVNVNPAWAEKNRAALVRFIKAHIRSLRWINDAPDQAAEFLTKEMGMKPPYGKIGVDYFVKHKVYPSDGAVTLEGFKMNIQVQANDGFVKEPLPGPEKYLDLSYLKQAQKELGL